METNSQSTLLDDLLTHTGWIRTLASSLVQDPADAEDATQETLITALEHPPNTDLPLRPWLRRVLQNTVRKQHRTDQRRRQREEKISGPTSSTQPDELVARVALQQDIVQAVLELTEPYRCTIILRYFEGLTATEIAKRQETTAAAIRQRLKRAREQLRESLDCRYGNRGAWMAAFTVLLPGKSTPSHAENLAPQAASSATLSFLSPSIMKKIIIGLGAAVVLIPIGSIWLQQESRETEQLSVLNEQSLTTQNLERIPNSASRELLKDRTKPISKIDEIDSQRADFGTLTVTVLSDSDQKPVPNALVIVKEQHENSLHPQLVLQTDSEGVVKFEQVARGQKEVALLRGSSESIRIYPDFSHEMMLYTEPGMTVVGEVVDKLGAPIEGAQVWISEKSPHINNTHIIATTNKEGQFEVAGLSDKHDIGATFGNYAPSVPQWVHGQPGTKVPVRIVLGEPAASVQGKVVNQEGQPLAMARILFGRPSNGKMFLHDRSEGDAPPQVTHTNDNGEFELRNVPFGVQPYRVWHKDHSITLGEVDVRDSEKNEALISMVGRTGIYGQVTNHKGEPVADCRVQANPHNPLIRTSIVTGKSGHFELNQVQAGKVRFVADHDEWGHAEIELELDPWVAEEWNPVLTLVPRIHGSLVDVNRQPLVGWEIALLQQEPEMRRIAMTRSHAGGTFVFANVPEGPYTLHVFAPGTRSHFPTHIQRDVQVTGQPYVIQVKEKTQEQGSVLARIVTPDGTPAMGVVVIATHEKEGLWRTFTPDDLGVIRMERVPPGDVEILLESKDYPWSHLGIHSIERNETLDLGLIELVKPGHLEGILSGLLPEQLRGIKMKVKRIGVDSPWMHGPVLRTHDRFHTSGLAPGEYELIVEGPEIQTLQHRFSLQFGERIHATIALQSSN